MPAAAGGPRLQGQQPEVKAAGPTEQTLLPTKEPSSSPRHPLHDC